MIAKSVVSRTGDAGGRVRPVRHLTLQRVEL